MHANAKRVHILLILCGFLLLVAGCTQPPIEQHYIEMVSQDANSFHEFILFPNGEVVEKKGSANLDLNNQFTFFTISAQATKTIFDESTRIFAQGTTCESGNKELFIFDVAQLQHACFDTTSAFDELFTALENKTSTSPPQQATFVHIVYFGRGEYVDMHVHSSGTVITTTYVGNQVTSARIATLDQAKVTALTRSISPAVLTKENRCTDYESQYEYVELQKGSAYTYFYNCTKNTQEKQNFFTTAMQLVRN